MNSETKTCQHEIPLNITCFICEQGFQKVLVALENASDEEIRELETKLGRKITVDNEVKE
jgi:hypothetical protein